MLESTITAKGQTTLPKDVRKALGLEAGDKVRFVIVNNEVRIIKAQPIAALAGVLRRPGQKAVSLETMQKAMKSGAKASAGFKK